MSNFLGAYHYQPEHLNTTGPLDNENLFLTEILEKAISVGYSILNSPENSNKQNVNNEDIQFSEKNAITQADVDAVRNISEAKGEISINEFSSDDIVASTSWAKKFYSEIGFKSPFFRAWFGDWRANEKTKVSVIYAGKTEGKNPRGVFKNKDTGWNINSSSVGYDETTSHSGKDKLSLIAMRSVDEIIKNSVLLDTEVSSYGRGKKSIYTAFMHKFYSPVVIDSKPYIAKLAVDESYAPGQNDTNKKFYHVRAIKIEPVSSVGIGFNHTPIMDGTSSDISISDLFQLVKTYDKEFNPKEPSKVVNGDGTPKIMYHGSREQFTVFDKKKAKSSGYYGRGFYFTDSDSHAKQYGNIYAVYLDVKNPLKQGENTVNANQIKAFLEAVAENEDYSIENYGTYDVSKIMKKIQSRDVFAVIQDINATAIGDMVEAVKLWNKVNGTNFDGIVVPTETVVFEPTQIKSATDNIGTFDKGNEDIQFSEKNGDIKKAEELSETDFRFLLEQTQYGVLDDDTYIPMRISTPEFFRDVVFEHSKGKITVMDVPLASQVEHVRQNMEEEDNASYGNARPHELSIDDVVSISKEMGHPAYIVLQKNGRYAMIVSFYSDKSRKRVIASIDFARNKKPTNNYKYRQYMNGYNEGYYNIIVTQYQPDSFDSYLDECEIIYDKKKMNGKYQVGSGRVVTFTHDTPFIDNSILNSPENSNKQNVNNEDIQFSERDYPIDAAIKNKVNDAITKSTNEMHTISEITQAQNNAINRLVNSTRSDAYRGRYTGGKHLLSDNAIRHVISEHGDFLREALRAQLPMTPNDIARHLSAVKDSKNPSNIIPSNTKRGTPSIITAYEVNGYTLYAEEIKKSQGKNTPSDLIGHTMYKAPTLATAAVLATSARTLPKRQSMMLHSYYTTGNADLSSGNFIIDLNGNPEKLYFAKQDNTPKADLLSGGLITLSSDKSNFTDKSKSYGQGYVVCKKPFYITADNRVFSNSETNVAEKINELKKQGYDCFIFDKVIGDNYMVAVVNKAQIISDNVNFVADEDTQFSERDNARITADMSDEERTEILSKKSIVAPIYEGQADFKIQDNVDKLKSEQIGLVKKTIVAIAEHFGIIGADIRIEDVDVEITLSRSNLKESVSKKATPIELAKLLPILKKSVSHAIGIERHDNRYFFDSDTVYFENLLGGYADNEYFVPVRFGLKHSKSGKATLYVVVDQNKIPLKELEQKKKTEVVNTAGPIKTEQTVSRSVKYSISQIIPLVKSKDLLRYIPDDMLNPEQKTAKWEAIAETIKTTNEKNDKKYSDFIASGNKRAANEMVVQAAKANGYTVKAYHGGDHFFTVFGKGNKTSSAPEGAYFFTDNMDVAYSYTAYKNIVDLNVNNHPIYKQATPEGRIEENRVSHGGVYPVYLKLKNPYIVDFEGRHLCNKVNGMDINEIAVWAKENGYDGVIAKNIIDAGDMGDVNYEEGNTRAPSTDYIIFDSARAKSSETITYDDEGNIIPISERFNTDKEDIRFSERDYSYENLSASDYYENGKIYSYDFLVAQKNMAGVQLPKTGTLTNEKGKIDDNKVIDFGIKNALSVGTKRGNKVYVENDYTKRELRIDNSTIKHGLDGTYNRHLTNARIGSVIGSIVKNAIPVNGLKNSSDIAVGTYAMASYCYDDQGREFIAIVTVEQQSGNVEGIETYDVAHAVSGRQKKSSQVDTKSQGVYPIKATDISISHLIEIVNSTHQSILSDDVLEHLGEKRNPKGSYSDKVLFSERNSERDNARITADMSDAKRYEILKNKKISDVPSVTDIPKNILDSIEKDLTIGNILSWEDVNKYYGKEKRILIQKIASEFGVFKDYKNTDVSLDFEFSKNNFRESYGKQKKNYDSYAKMFSVFDDVIDKAIGIEVHNRNDEGYKHDPTLNNVYVMVSVFKDGDLIYPVKLEVKEFKDKQNSLYVAISLEAIKMTEVSKQGTTENSVAQNSRSVTISIHDILKNVNTKDIDFLKYIPNGFLNTEQIRAKEAAIEIERSKYLKNKSLDNEVQHSERDTGTSAYDLVGEHKTLEKRYKKLAADFENYKQRVKLDRTLTKGRVLKQSELEAIARYLIKQGDSNYKASELAKVLRYSAR